MWLLLLIMLSSIMCSKSFHFSNSISIHSNLHALGKSYAHIRKRKFISNAVPTEPVRVRFAPSPTGSLHVGGARTALFNWLLARKTNGTFVVRVEDTDLSRSTKASENSILNDLRWLKMDWDEGPDVEGCKFGPYRQSERLDIYKKWAEDLIEKGLAYRCFCTEAELEKQKIDAAGQGLQNIGYLGTWRDADPKEVQRRLDAGEPYAVRFKVPPNKIIVLRDAVRGLVTWNGDATLGDFVIMRSNGMPVYNFCVAVDDYLMNITHVVRAEEHLSNTPKQLLVLEALGCKKPPVYAHCSLILATDRSKLSKRHGATSVAEFAAQGYSQDAMVNYLCNLGWNSGQKREIYKPHELIKLFDLKRIIPSAAVFDMRKLNWVNGQHLNMLPADQYAETLLAQLRGDFNNNPLLKYHIQVDVRDDNATQGINTENTLPKLPIYPGKQAHVDGFIDSLVGVLRKDLQIGSDVNRLLASYASYPIYDTLTSNDTRPLEVVEDHYKHFLTISKLILRDYRAYRERNGRHVDGGGNSKEYADNDKPLIKNSLFFLGETVQDIDNLKSQDLIGLWKNYVSNITHELNDIIQNQTPVESSNIIPSTISPITQNIVMMAMRIILTGCTKGPNVAQLLYMLNHCEEFLDVGVDGNAHKSAFRFITLDQRMKILQEIVKTMEHSIAA